MVGYRSQLVAQVVGYTDSGCPCGICATDVFSAQVSDSLYHCASDLDQSARQGGEDLHPNKLYCNDPQRGYAVYCLESVPGSVFDAWLSEILESTPINDSFFHLAIAGYRPGWNVVTKRWVINGLIEHRALLPIYGGRDAALSALKAQGGSDE